LHIARDQVGSALLAVTSFGGDFGANLLACLLPLSPTAANPLFPKSRNPISAILQNAELTHASLTRLRSTLRNFEARGALPPELLEQLASIDDDVEAVESIGDCARAQEIIANDILVSCLAVEGDAKADFGVSVGSCRASLKSSSERTPSRRFSSI